MAPVTTIMIKLLSMNNSLDDYGIRTVSDKLTFRKYVREGKYPWTQMLIWPRDGCRCRSLVRRGELLSADCPSREVLKHVTSRWGVLVLMVLLDEHLPFQRFAPKSRWREREDARADAAVAGGRWLCVRTSYDEVPPHVDYRLTPLGEEVARQVTSLADWIEVNLSRILSARANGVGEGAHV